MWLYENRTFDQNEIQNYVGFVYLITNTTNNKMYVGKKLFTKSKRYQKNKKKKTKRVESDWNEYTGSNDQLNDDILKGDQITKQILHLCTSKGWLTYMETKEILIRDALINENYYNFWVQCKIRRTHLK